MSHKAVLSLISDTVKSLDDTVTFVYARESDFNAATSRLPADSGPRVHLDPLKATKEYTDNSFNLTTTWNIGITFYLLDNLQGAEKETEAILDRTDTLATKFINKLNDYSITATDNGAQTDMNELSGIELTPIIKVSVSAFTGHVLTFRMTTPDDFDYCSLYD